MARGKLSGKEKSQLHALWDEDLRDAHLFPGPVLISVIAFRGAQFLLAIDVWIAESDS